MTKCVWIVSAIVFVVSLIFAETWVLSLENKLRARILRIQVVVIIQGLLLMMSIFLWRTLSTAFEFKVQQYNKPQLQFLWKCILICYMILAHCSYMANVFLVRTEPTVMAIVCYLFLGIHIQMFTFIIVTKVVNFVIKFLRKRPISINTSTVLAVIYSVSLTFYGYYNINQPPVVKNVSIPVKHLPPSLNGFTIVLLSDIHLGPTVGRRQFEIAVDISNSLQPGIFL